MLTSGSEFITITDEKGMVVARGHSPKVGDDVNNQETVQAARKGQSIVGIVAGTVQPFTLRAGAPIMSGGKVVGTVGIGISLTTEKYVDTIKQNSGLEFTVFKGDTRAQTTIKDASGKRLVGTKITSTAIIDAVLNKGQTYFGDYTIAGKPYKVAYWPITDMNGKSAGMWFVGNPLEQLIQLQEEATLDAIIASVIVVVLFTLVAFFVGRQIAAPVKNCTGFAVDVADGKLDSALDVHSSDETSVLAHALHQMVENLKQRIAQADQATENAKAKQAEAETAVKEAEAAKAQAERAKRDGMLQAANDLTSVVDAVSDVSKALNEGIASSDKGAKEQAHIVSETVHSMDEMKVAVHGVAQSASQASSVAQDVRAKAQEGVEQVAQVTESMAELSVASAKISKDMEVLGKQANGIGAILSTISDIADQTNLLALNAAIEAARAGEAGRGFAVVADEVRKLAEKTMAATHEVNNSISAIQQSVHTNIKSVGETGEMAHRVTEIVQHSGAVLDEIHNLAEASADQVRAIAAAAEEQSVSCDHIGQSVDAISNIANQVVGTMQEADSAVKDLLHQADNLSGLIEEMKKG